MRYRTGLIIAVLVLGCHALRGAVIDRIEMVVDHQVITELELEEEIRVADFLNGSSAPVEASEEQRRVAAGRLIDQVLLKHEMALSHYAPVEEEIVDKAVEGLKQSQGPSAFGGNLSRYQVTADELRGHLAFQLTTLRFIEFRFRPELGIDEPALQDYYRQFATKWASEHPARPVPTFEGSRADIRKALLEQRTDAALDQWLNEMRRRVPITYLDSALQAGR